MTALIGIHDLTKSFGTATLFRNLSFSVVQGDRLGMIGPNGAGKSTLLEIIADLEGSDAGSISRRRDLRIGYVPQFSDFPALPIEEVLLGKNPDPDLEVQGRILLGKAQFTDFSQDASTLSGGWKKRLDIVRALLHSPDLLLLDEPTNHLDLEGIEWLERFLMRENFTYIVVSHDRYFLEKVTNKTIEINKRYPDGLFMVDGALTAFLEKKELFFHVQAQEERGLKSQVRDEVDWLRRSPKARTTKSTSRIQRAHELIERLEDVRERNKIPQVGIEFAASERETRKLLQAKNLTKSLGGKQLFKGIDITLSPGSRLGVVGKNGMGKTTLLQILSGKVTPDLGTIKYADNLKLVYFDQHRSAIPPDVSLKRALSPLGDYVSYLGQQIHVNGWAKKFLFSPERLEMPVGYLSGGERARIQIARLMLEPADILFLDEPTNDLDIQTLEVIEESLKEFPGAVVLITHDRCLMDRVCTQIVGLGTSNEQFLYADYRQWERAAVEVKTEKPAAKTAPKPVKKTAAKLSYKEQRELDGMSAAIEALEGEIASLTLQLEAPDLQSDAKKSLALYNTLADAEQRREALFTRWQELEEKENSC